MSSDDSEFRALLLSDEVDWPAELEDDATEVRLLELLCSEMDELNMLVRLPSLDTERSDDREVVGSTVLDIVEEMNSGKLNAAIVPFDETNLSYSCALK